MEKMQTVENPPIPFSYPLGYGGLPYDAELTVHGCTYKNHDKNFSIELRAGSAGQNVALHLNFRFKWFGEHVVVVNTCNDGKWEKEERHPNILHIGDTFRIKIENHMKHYLITLNEHRLCHFKHRIPPQSVTDLEIKGNIVVHRVHMVGINTTAPQFGTVVSVPLPSNAYGHPPPAYNPYDYSAPVPNAMPAPQYTTPQAYSPSPIAVPPPPVQYPTPTLYPQISPYSAAPPIAPYPVVPPQTIYVGGLHRACSCDGLHRCHHHQHHHHHGLGHLFGRHHHHHHHC